MKLPDLLPPADILSKFGDIETQLRQRKRLGTLGQIGFLLFFALQLTVTLGNSTWLIKWIEALNNSNWDRVLQQLLLFVSLLLLIFFGILWIWSKIWLEESQSPFRYTFSVSDFKPVEKTLIEDKLSWLQYDLVERLSQRIGRLSLKEEEEKAAKEPDRLNNNTSHIHIGGYYIIREEPREREKNQWIIEVTPWVRIGSSSEPKRLAFPVRFPIKIIQENHSTPTEGTEQPQATSSLSVDEYEKLLERIFFSVATQIYEQIRDDVQRKINLLPTSYFRATAYFYEAEDYAKSNTLYGYEQALELYKKAMSNYDPQLYKEAMLDPLCEKPFSPLFWQQLFQTYWEWVIRYFWRPLRNFAAYLLPRLGRIDIMSAKAEIGYANTLVSLSLLSGLSGQRIRAIFEARPVAKNAKKRLRSVNQNIPGFQSCQFDAYLTLALIYHQHGVNRKAKEYLIQTRQLMPAQAERDARYLSIKGFIEGRQRLAVSYFRQAVELNPRLEIAQFSLAVYSELLWRRRSPFERSVAELIFEEYEKVLRLNPSNISTWANQGYMCWLLGEEDIHRARDFFLRGREYKEIKPETFVSEIDYGLARIEAEQGNFERAYEHYTKAVSAYIAQGFNYSGTLGGYFSYYFDLINENVLDRFRRYKEKVERYWRLLQGKKQLIDYFEDELQSLGSQENLDLRYKKLEELFFLLLNLLTLEEQMKLNEWLRSEKIDFNSLESFVARLVKREIDNIELILDLIQQVKFINLIRLPLV